MKRGSYLIFLLLVSTEVVALGISPSSVRFDFEPNLHREIKFNVFSTENQTLNIFVEGDLARYITLSRRSIQGSGELFAVIDLPPKLENTGNSLTHIGAEEVSATGGSIGAKVRIKSRVIIRTPFEGVYIDPPSLSISSINKNERAATTLTVQSFGTENISRLFANIDVLDFSDNMLASRITDIVSLKSLEQTKFETELETSNLKPGSYKGQAEVFYDDLSQKSNEAVFRIGELEVFINNYTKEVVAGQINSFDVEIESSWNNEIENIFAEVVLEEETRFRTLDTNLKAWEIKSLQGFLDATNIDPGTYSIIIELNYEGQIKKVEGTILIKRPTGITTYNTAIIIIVVMLIILTNLAWFIKSKRVKKKKSKINSSLKEYFLAPIKKRK